MGRRKRLVALAARIGEVTVSALAGVRPKAAVRSRMASSGASRCTTESVDRSVRTEVVALAWPIAIAMLGDTAMGLVDTKLVAGLGSERLGGVGVAVTLTYLCYAVVFGLMRGVKVRTAHAVGAGRPADGAVYAWTGVVMGAVAGASVFFLGRDATWILVRLGLDASMIPHARDFLAARSCGAPALCMLSALVQYRQGAGDTRTPMVIGLFGNVVNAGLAYALIHGRFGLPALGVKGAGYGTALAEWLDVLVMIAVISSRYRRAGHVVSSAQAPVRISFHRAWVEVTALGVPTGAQFGLEMLAFTTMTVILGSLGAAEIAAHQVAMAVIRTSFLPGLAVAEAASVLVGRALGGRALYEADRVTRTSIALAAGFMSACGLVFALFGGAIARSFTDEPEVFPIVRKLLLVAALFQTCDAVTMVLRGSLRAAQDVRVVALIGVGCAWCCVPVAALVLGRYAGLGAVGGWWGFVADTAIAAMLFWARWTRGSWRTAYARLPMLVADPGPATLRLT